LNQNRTIHRYIVLAVLMPLIMIFQLSTTDGFAGEIANVEFPAETPPDSIPPDTTEQQSEGNLEQTNDNLMDKIVNSITDII